MMLTPLYDWSKYKGKTDGVTICDAYAMALALDPTIGNEPQKKRVCVELGGHHCRGHVVTDHYDLTDHFFEVTCFTYFDLDKYVEILKDSLKNA